MDTQTMEKVTRWKPEGSQLLARAEDVGVEVWEYQKGDVLSAIAYAGKGLKSVWHYRFRTRERMIAKTAELITNYRAHKKRITESRESARAFRHQLKVGDILTGSWGYDQTNAEAWQVVEALPSSVKIRPVAHRAVEGTAGFMSESVVPVKDQFTGPERLTRVRPTSDGVGSCSANEFCSLTKWTGGAQYSSWYA